MIFLCPYRLTYDLSILAKNYHTKFTGATICCIGYPTSYVYASVLWVTRDQKLKRGGMLGLCRVAQNKWDLLLKLCMGYFLTIEINYDGIMVSVCVFSMVKPVQCLLNMDRK